MRPVPGNRYVIVILITGAALFWDLYSKDVVFRDLGYPGGGAPILQWGDQTIFARPKLPDAGESVPYLTGWMTFRLCTNFNHGALWGVGQGYSWAFATMSVLAVLGILYWLFVHGAATSLWLTVALAFVLGGTLGNLYDRTGMHGCVDANGETIHAVRDFLLFTFGDFSWPVFNFADTYLVTGAIMLVLQSFSAEATSVEKPRTSESAEPGGIAG
jgi:signal peptidase II